MKDPAVIDWANENLTRPFVPEGHEYRHEMCEPCQAIKDAGTWPPMFGKAIVREGSTQVHILRCAHR